MPADKDRLYVSLHVRGGAVRMPGGEDKYHWALLVGPKIEDDESQGRRFHAKERMVSVDGQARSAWEFEERDTSALPPSLMVLVRVLVGKVRDTNRLADILRGVPVRGGQPGWNCVGWVREALDALGGDGRALGSSVTDWQTIRDAALRYVQRKAAEHRFDGTAEPGRFESRKVPTYDLLRNTETIA